MIGFDKIKLGQMTPEIWESLTKQEQDEWWKNQHSEDCDFDDTYCKTCNRSKPLWIKTSG